MSALHGGTRRLGSALAVVALLAALLVASIVGLAPPAAQPATAPATEFSAVRAQRDLALLLGAQEPHPTGSAANAAVRRRLQERLASLGVEVESRSAFVCSPWRTCADVVDLVARLPRPVAAGAAARRAVLLAAHYDSVPAGPGAGDDGAGVAAVLETARALLAGPPTANPVILLLSDGEELGLLGARAFAAAGLSAARIGAVLNVDDRGDSGPSLLFETGDRQAASIGLFAGRVRRASTSSFFDALYRLLPNDTDFTVFKRRDLPGLNFALIGSPLRYHTRADRLEHLDLGSLQHHGDHLLAAARAFGAADLARLPTGGAVFFDLFGRRVVRWSAAWSLPAAIAALATLLAAAALLVLRGRLHPGGLAAGLLAWLAVLAAAYGGGRAVLLLARATGAAPGPWTAHPAPLVAAFLAAGLAVVLLTLPEIERASASEEVWLAGWTAWAILAVAAALVLPGAAYLFVAPAIAAGAAIFVWALARRERSAPLSVVLLPLVVAGTLWLPLVWLLEPGLGSSSLPVATSVVALLAVAAAPALPRVGERGRWALPGAALAVVVAGVAWAAVTPAFTSDDPRPLDLLLLQDEGGSQWLADAGGGALPPALVRAADFGAERTAALPWSPTARFFAAPGPRIDTPYPEIALRTEGSEAGRRRIVLHLATRRRAPWLRLAWSSASPLAAAAVAGTPVPLEPSKRPAAAAGGWRSILVAGPPPEGVDVELVFERAAPISLAVVDESFGLPAAGAALLAARPDWASPIGGGDRTLLLRRLDLP